jgi:hypothetical protein
LKSRPPEADARPPGETNWSCEAVIDPFSTDQPSAARPAWK